MKIIATLHVELPLQATETLRSDPEAVEDQCEVGEEVKQRTYTIQPRKFDVQSLHLDGDLAQKTKSQLHCHPSKRATYPWLIVRLLLLFLQAVTLGHRPIIFMSFLTVKRGSRWTYLLVIGPNTTRFISCEVNTVTRAYACATSTIVEFVMFSQTCGCPTFQRNKRPPESAMQMLKCHGRVRCCSFSSCSRAAKDA